MTDWRNETSNLLDRVASLRHENRRLSAENKLLKEQADTNADFIRQYQRESTEARVAWKAGYERGCDDATRGFRFPTFEGEAYEDTAFEEWQKEQK